MINTTAKMRWVQQKAREFLLNKGFVYVWIKHHTMWSKDINIFGAKFDGFAINESGVIVFIQVKANQKPNMKPYRDLFLKHLIPYLVLVYYDRKGFKMWR